MRDHQDSNRLLLSCSNPSDHFKTLESLDSLGYAPETQARCRLDVNFTLVSTLDGNQTFSVNGDKMTPGVTIFNSEAGLAFLSIVASNLARRGIAIFYQTTA